MQFSISLYATLLQPYCDENPIKIEQMVSDAQNNKIQGKLNTIIGYILKSI